jgi:hypothetical protein
VSVFPVTHAPFSQQPLGHVAGPQLPLLVLAMLLEVVALVEAPPLVLALLALVVGAPPVPVVPLELAFECEEEAVTCPP